MSMSTARIAAVAATGLAGVAAFQIALALGAPLGRAAWGGTYTQLPVELRIGSAISAAFLFLAALVVLGRGGFWAGNGPSGLYRWGTWALVSLLGLSALANFASASRWENFLMGPIALALSILTLLVALGPARVST
ncbi:hypothetical protein OG589_25755 [Sphaerisporangium sp. NBC_01403]|uniref:hypothetical protein n=1 Tax=Sphaerisporangium sp. NBC_01403 TaxID=2903599 RepID=UPI00324E27B9